jgi:hypothetical protein
MPDAPEPSKPVVADIQARLQDVARKLRRSGPLDLESQEALAELVDELSKALQPANLPPAEVAHLADSTAHLAESLQHHADAGPLARARARLENALVNAESHAPTAVGLARRLLDALSNIGI